MRLQRDRRLAIGLALALVLWGGYVSLAWLGVPEHRAALLPEAAPVSGCAEGQWLCAGISTVAPAAGHAIGRWLRTSPSGSVSPFFWFILIGTLASAGCYLRLRSRTSASNGSLTLSPLRIGVAWVVMLWLLFTVMSVGMNGTTPYRRIFEPTAQAYPGAGLEALIWLDPVKWADLSRPHCRELLSQHALSVLLVRQVRLVGGTAF